MKRKETKKELRAKLAEAEKLRDGWCEAFTEARDALKKLQRTTEDVIKELEK